MHLSEIIPYSFLPLPDKACKVSSGNLERSYRRSPKGAKEGQQDADEGAGICHLCMAGHGVDWENL